MSVEDGLLSELGTGATFGELALLYNAPRAATVEAVTDAVVWCIDRSDFKKILRAQAQKKLAMYYKLVEKTELLSVLLREVENGGREQEDQKFSDQFRTKGKKL